MTDIVGGGPHRLEAGQRTDDTSMALGLAESLIEKGGMDLTDQRSSCCVESLEAAVSRRGGVSFSRFARR